MVTRQSVGDIMITDLNSAVEETARWIRFQAERANSTSLVLGISGGVDSAVTGALCVKTGLPTIGVIMPCHSSPESLSRAIEAIESLGMIRYFFNLEPAFDSIMNQTNETERPIFESKDIAGALRSCLRAPTLDFVAKRNQAIIVGTGNRDEDEVTRYFQKRGDGSVDICPIAKYHKSEIYQLASHLEVPESIIKATPTADLWGPNSGQEDEKELGLTYDEVEWGIQTAESYKQTEGPLREWHFQDVLRDLQLSNRQKTVLAKLADMEYRSRHKENSDLPVFAARTFPWISNGSFRLVKL